MIYEYDERGHLKRPTNFLHLEFKSWPELWEMQKQGGTVGGVSDSRAQVSRRRLCGFRTRLKNANQRLQPRIDERS